MAKANGSEMSLQKWIDGYFGRGLNGWRAFHTSIDHIGGDDHQLQAKIARSIRRVRKVLLSPQKHNGNGTSLKRLHMNAYLTSIINKFGAFSVDELFAAVEQALGVALGTVYVSDLLAIA